MKHNDTISIRLADRNDADTVLPLAKAMAHSFVVDDSAFHQSFIAILHATHMQLFVAVDNKTQTVVGYCLTTIHPTFYANGIVAWVEELAVGAAHQRQGIGAALMNEVEHFARKNDCKLVALATRRADDFYNAISYTNSATYWRKVLL
jgi:GNAT superfamily N-acetyltransferase